MSEPQVPPGPLTSLRLRYKDAYDSVSMLFYLLLVYGWGLWVYPLGRDFAHLANRGADLPFGAKQLFALEMDWFGNNPVGYHLVNLALMYGCMLLVYYFVNATVRGLWWFGTLAACLFMANPVHSESMLNLSGVGDLVPCLVGLGVLASYAWLTRTDWVRVPTAIVFGLLVLAVLAYEELRTLGLVLYLYEVLAVSKSRRRHGRALSAVAISLVAVLTLGSNLGDAIKDPVQSFGSLYLIFYPIGFLPETVQAFHETPWLVWAAVAQIAFVVWLLQRKARRGTLLFALFSMLFLSCAPGDFDWVHMIGGGQLLLANALFVLGVIVVVFRIMDHPKWRIPMISITSMLVLVMFGLQWKSIRKWHDAGQYVRHFQELAASATQDGTVSMGILPDFWFYYGAPAMLSASVRYDTPFSKQLPAIPLLRLNPDVLSPEQYLIHNWSAGGGEVTVVAKESPNLFRYFPGAARLEVGAAQALSSVWGDEMPSGTVAIQDIGDKTIRVAISGESLPEQLVPGNLSREESDREAEPDTEHQ